MYQKYRFPWPSYQAYTRLKIIVSINTNLITFIILSFLSKKMIVKKPLTVEAKHLIFFWLLK